MNTGNAIGTSGDWKLLNSNYRQEQISQAPVTIAEYSIASGAERRLVWMWYLSGDELTAKPYKVKLKQAATRLAGRPAPVFLFAISSKVGPQQSDAVASLREFARGMSFSAPPSTVPVPPSR